MASVVILRAAGPAAISAADAALRSACAWRLARARALTSARVWRYAASSSGDMAASLW